MTMTHLIDQRCSSDTQPRGKHKEEEEEKKKEEKKTPFGGQAGEGRKEDHIWRAEGKRRSSFLKAEGKLV